MNRSRDDRLNADDLKRMAEHETPRTGDRVVNRGDREPPSPHRAVAADLARGHVAETWDDRANEPPVEKLVTQPARTQLREQSDEDIRLFHEGDASSLRRRWSDIQAGFVDQPRRAVEQADMLVAECTERLTKTFVTTRERLEQQWSRGEQVTTEELRVALQRYRAFFDRLLSV